MNLKQFASVFAVGVTFAAMPLLSPRVAQAQTIARTPQVAVLDFSVGSSVLKSRQASFLSREATDAVVEEMRHTARFDPVSRSQVEQGIRDLNIVGPTLTKTTLLRLGQSLGVDYIAVGSLNDVATAKSGERRASLSVLFLDTVTGEWANGASATGTIPAASVQTEPTQSDAQTVQALGDAAFSAVQTLNTFQLPQATVLIIDRNDTVRINGGARNGIRPGQEYVILRGNDRVGKIRIVSVDAQDARAHIIDSGKGIRPEDRARLVFGPGESSSPF